MTPAELAAMAIIGQVLDKPGSLTDADIINVAMEASTDPQQAQLDITRALAIIAGGVMHAAAAQAGSPDGAMEIYAAIYEAYQIEGGD